MSSPPASLAGVAHKVTQAQIARYADATGDHNPLHLDPEFAATTPFGRPVAHGMLVLAFASELLTHSFGRAWLCGGKLRARFRSPVYPGDVVTASGTLTSQDAGRATYRVVVQNQDGVDVITADATVPLSS